MTKLTKAQRVAHSAVIRPQFRRDNETAKDRQRRQLEADLASFLEAGNEIEELPGPWTAGCCANCGSAFDREARRGSEFCSTSCYDASWWRQHKMGSA